LAATTVPATWNRWCNARMAASSVLSVERSLGGGNLEPEPFTVHWTPSTLGGIHVGVGEDNPYYDHWVHLIVMERLYD